MPTNPSPITLPLLALVGLGALACDDELDTRSDAAELRAAPSGSSTGGYNLQLSTKLRFHAPQPEASVARGRATFGVAANLVDEDPSEALFEGFSAVAGREIVSNGRTCFTCHRGSEHGFGLPAPPLSASVDLGDTLFTGIEADAGGDPDAFTNLDQHGLFKYRVNRFDPRLPLDAPIRQVHGWRKSPRLHNLALQAGFLTDLRGRLLQDAARGAFQSHTQDADDRFDDLLPPAAADDVEAFLFTLVTDPLLAALRDPSDPLYAALLADPYYTVPITTAAQERGRKVFDQFCYASCHNMPNVFSSLDNVEPLGNGERPPEAPSWAAAVGRAYNIGVSERNLHGLRFTRFVGPGQFEPIVLQLANEDGSIEDHEVEFDLGLALTSGRTADIGRFKVPQLRELADNAPYFHDNSAATIPEVVDYFLSDAYANSADGQDHPIRLSAQQRADLIEFLAIL